MEAIANSKIGKAIMKSRAVKFVRRMLPLLLAVWVKIDMFLDVRQSVTYYNHGTVDGAYAKWALKYQNERNSTYLHTVSKTYLVCASVVWITSPLLFSVFVLGAAKIPLISCNILTHCFFDYEIPELCKTRRNCCKIMVGIIFLPIDMLASSIMIYILIPYMSLRRGVKIAWTGQDYANTDEIISNFDFDASELTALKAFEFLGEALPQLILAIVFTSNNFPFLSETQTYFGANEFTISLVSMIFSAGSLCFGLCTGIPEMYSKLVLGW